MTAQGQRLEDVRHRTAHWRRRGPYHEWRRSACAVVSPGVVRPEERALGVTKALRAADPDRHAWRCSSRDITLTEDDRNRTAGFSHRVRLSGTGRRRFHRRAGPGAAALPGRRRAGAVLGAGAGRALHSRRPSHPGADVHRRGNHRGDQASCRGSPPAQGSWSLPAVRCRAGVRARRTPRQRKELRLSLVPWQRDARRRIGPARRVTRAGGP